MKIITASHLNKVYLSIYYATTDVEYLLPEDNLSKVSNRHQNKFTDSLTNVDWFNRGT